MSALASTPSGLLLAAAQSAIWAVDTRTGDTALIAGHATERNCTDGPALTTARFVGAYGTAIDTVQQCAFIADHTARA